MTRVARSGQVRIIEILLIVLVTGLLVFNLYQFFSYRDPRLARLKEAAEPADDNLPVPQVSPPWKKVSSFDSYEAVLKERDIFSEPRIEGKAGPAPEPTPTAAAKPALSDRYRLVGIILDGNPQAIVEDLRDQKTLFVQAGDTLEAGRIEQIGRAGIKIRVDSRLEDLFLDAGGKK